MDERERYIRAKYERREYYGPPSRDSLSRACKEMEMSIDQLPPGYMDGVDTSISTRTSTSSTNTGSTEASNAPMNPALLRRQQKKDAEIAEARAAEEAVERAERERQEAIVRAQAQAAAQAQALADAQARVFAQQNSAALNDIFGASSVPPVAINPVNSILSQFSSAPASTTNNTGSLFAGLSTSSTTPASSSTQPVSGFNFTNNSVVPNQSSTADLFAGTTIGGNSTPFASSFLPTTTNTNEPSATGFNFLGSSVASNVTPSFNQASVSGGDMFANLNTVSTNPTSAVVTSFPPVTAIPPPIFAPANNAATISSVFDEVSIIPEVTPVVVPSVPMVPSNDLRTPNPQDIVKPPPLHLHQNVGSTPISSNGSVNNNNQQFTFSSYDNQHQRGNNYSGISSYPSTTGSLTPSPDPSSALLPGIGNMGEAGTVLVQSVSHSELGSPATYRKLFSMPLPDSMDGIFVRQNIITQIHAKAASDLMAEFQSKQKALNEAFQTELQLLQNQLSKVTNSNGRPVGTNTISNTSVPTVNPIVSTPVLPSFVPPAPAPAPVSIPTAAATNLFSGMSTAEPPISNSSSTSSGFSFVPSTPSSTEPKRDIPANPFASVPSPAPTVSATIPTNPFQASSSFTSKEGPSKSFFESSSGNSGTDSFPSVPPPLPEPTEAPTLSSSMFGGLSVPSTVNTAATSSFSFTSTVPPTSTPSSFTSSSSNGSMFAGLSSSSESSISGSVNNSSTIPVNPFGTSSTSAPVSLTSKFTSYHAADDDDSPQGPPPAPPDEDEAVHTTAMSANAASVAALFQ